MRESNGRIRGICVAIMVLAMAMAGIGNAGAQTMRWKRGPASPSLRDFRLERSEIERIENVLEESEDEISKARAEIQVIQARLARLMLEKDPSTEQMGALVKESLDWEYKVRMAQIGRQISIRKIVGDERWSLLLKMGRGFRQITDPRMMMEMLDGIGIGRKDFDTWTKLFIMLKRLD